MYTFTRVQGCHARDRLMSFKKLVASKKSVLLIVTGSYQVLRGIKKKPGGRG
jgi:hypothetical protein